MAVFSEKNSKMEVFEGQVTSCRDIYDNVVLFGRDGKIISSRSSDPHLCSGADFFALMSSDEASNISELCISFNYNRLIINTECGIAIIYTDTCGACGIMIALFPFAPADAIVSHFVSQALPSVFISSEALTAVGNSTLSGNVLDDIRRADEIFMTVNVAVAKYSYGSNLIQNLSEHLLVQARFLGCIGTARGILDVRPAFDNFSSEMFLTMTLCCILFARNYGLHRDFVCKVFEYNSHPTVAFRIDVDEGFRLIRNGEHIHPELDFCLRTADRRRTFFECYHHKENSAVIIAFTPEIDPIDGRIIKQDVEWQLESFWDTE